MLESPGDDNRGLTAWYDMAACDGVSVRGSDGEVIEKHNWAAQEITGGAFRLAAVPLSAKEASVYVQVVPLTLEEFRADLVLLELQESFSGLAAIKLGGGKIPLGPKEPGAMKAGFGVLPFVGINAAMEAEVVLPDSDALKAEMFGTLRAVSAPRCLTQAQWEVSRGSKEPPKGDRPSIMWPLYMAPNRNANAVGKFAWTLREYCSNSERVAVNCACV